MRNYFKNIDSDQLQQIADTLNPLVGVRLKKKIKEIKKKKVKEKIEWNKSFFIGICFAKMM